MKIEFVIERPVAHLGCGAEPEIPWHYESTPSHPAAVLREHAAARE